MAVPTREALVHSLYEASELEHTLMCTYLYAAFSLKRGEAEGLSATEAAATERWRAVILRVAREEMGHLAAVWNITAALGGMPRFGRGNFPLDPGQLPASLVVKLAPFSDAVVQHFVHLERPIDSTEPEGDGFAPEVRFQRAASAPRVTPMALDYDTVGEFYAALESDLRAFVDAHGDDVAFAGDPALQLSKEQVDGLGTRPVRCLKTALVALAAIREQGEGAPGHTEGSHYQLFVGIREELAALRAANPAFEPAWPAARNPVLRRPIRSEGRVWIEDEEAARTVDLANASYGLMLRLLAYSYQLPASTPDKRVAIELSLTLMRAITPLAERAARLPAGPSHPSCHAGMSFTALRDAAPLPIGPSAGHFVRERLAELCALASSLEGDDDRVDLARRNLADALRHAGRAFTGAVERGPGASPVKLPVVQPPAPTSQDGVDAIEARDLTLHYEGKRCIHARFCVTGAPKVFLANVQGPWIHPDAMGVDDLVAIAHACPSGAIRYVRKDGRADEAAPPVNLVSIRENGPYAVRAEIALDGAPAGYRATLCRCGASKNKPFCDGSHHAVDFAATGEPLTESADMLPVRSGPLAIDPQPDGPLRVSGNLEITSGTGRVVARVTSAKLCRCGGSSTKPFCDGTHARNGFRSDR